MKTIIYKVCILLWWQVLVTSVWAQETTALDEYVAKPDPNYTFTRYHTEDRLGYTAYFISMTSQQWRTTDEVDRTLWEHELIIYVPWVVHSDSPETAILFIDGGRNGGALETEPDDVIGGLASLSGSVFTVIKQIPNQPLYFADEIGRPRKEDEILAYSLDKFLTTGDPEWPVHLAMTKAAVRAMDTVQTFLASKSREIEYFVVLGGSKRGWTTWLAAAVDPRVKAIAPASIDMLNMQQQFEHHWGAYGFYAPAIEDYVEFNLPCRMQSPQGQELRLIIDPYEYRQRYTMPKLVVNSTGDQFFVPDSSQFYFADSLQPKQLRYSINTDHAQNEEVILAAMSWIEDINKGGAGPLYSWTLEPDGSIRVQTVTQPEQVLLWQATNPTARDFRLETLGPAWTSTELRDNGNGVYIGYVDPPPQGWTAFTVELRFGESDILKADQIYTTDVRVTPDVLPFADSYCQPEQDTDGDGIPDSVEVQQGTNPFITRLFPLLKHNLSRILDFAQ